MVSGCCWRGSRAGSVPQAAGPAASMRPVARSPFRRLADSGENLLCAREQGRLSGLLVEAWQNDLAARRDEMQLISTRLESEGISVDIVYGLDVLDRCLTRMEAIVG